MLALNILTVLISVHSSNLEVKGFDLHTSITESNYT